MVNAKLCSAANFTRTGPFFYVILLLRRRLSQYIYSLPVHGLYLDVFQKIKSAGFTAVSFYTFWGLHEPKRGAGIDFSGFRDVEPFRPLRLRGYTSLLGRVLTSTLRPPVAVSQDGAHETLVYGARATQATPKPGRITSGSPVFRTTRFVSLIDASI
jgi:hypothetical protein